MSNVYQINAEKNLILYTLGSSICLRPCDATQSGRPIILANDYSSSLTDVIFNNSIYYAYENPDGDFVVKSISKPTPVYTHMRANFPDCYNPNLCVIGDFLLLFYIINNPLNDTFSLRYILPLTPNDNPAPLFENNYDSIPVVTFCSVPSKLFIHISCDCEETIYCLNDKFSLKSLSYEYETLPSELTEKYEKEIKLRDSLIESAKLQYNELMDTAIKYRDEAIKWRSKFIR